MNPKIEEIAEKLRKLDPRIMVIAVDSHNHLTIECPESLVDTVCGIVQTSFEEAAQCQPVKWSVKGK